MGEEHFAELSVAYIGERRRKYAHDPWAIRGCGEHCRLSKEEIAQEDDRTRGEDAVERWAPSSHAGTINSVVVNQRSGVEKLDPRSGSYKVISIISVGTPGEKQDQRPQPLPASPDEAEDEIGHTWIINSYGFFQARLHQK